MDMRTAPSALGRGKTWSDGGMSAVRPEDNAVTRRRYDARELGGGSA